MNSKIKNGYKGLLLNFFYDMKKTAKIGVIITLSILLSNFLLNIIVMQFDGGDSNSNSGIMMIGFITMLITLFVYVVVSTSKVELYSKFSFPINRRIYAISNFLVLVVGSLALLMIVTILSPVELMLFKLVELFSDQFIYINIMTLGGFIEGFITSWLYLIAISSVSYCVFIYIRKYMIASLLTLAVLATMIISFGWLGNIIQFIFLEQNLGLFVAKLLSISVISHLLGYIPLRKMEVA